MSSVDKVPNDKKSIPTTHSASHLEKLRNMAGLDVWDILEGMLQVVPELTHQ